MAPPAGTLRVGRYFLALFLLLVLLYSIVFFGGRHTPKLGIDLVGGTEVVFTAKTDNGSAPSGSSMEQARQILSDRVNGTGVTQATVVIQGNNQLVVSIPGQDATDVQKLGAAAVLNFRGVVAAPVPVTCTPKGATGATSSTSPSPSASTSPQQAKASPSDSGAAAKVRPLQRATSTGSTTAKSTASPSATGSGTGSPTAAASPSRSSSSQAPPPCSSTSIAQVAKLGKFTVPLSDTDYDKLSDTNKQLLSAALAAFDCSSAQTEKDVAANYFIACAKGSEYGASSADIAFLLGPVIVAGKQIDSAAAVAPNAQQSTFNWTVSLSLKDSGQTKWGNYTSAHNVNGSQTAGSVTQCATSTTACANYVGFTLDGSVISAPVNLNAINGGNTQITGDFTASSAKDLANKLKFGALPLSFKPAKANTVSATLGTSQLRAGLLAGGIGLILVVIYSLLYYRALGLVTIASLLVSGALTYGCLVMLATQIGFTLSLAGIAGFIVAVGITADSFVVFFERLKDEVHEGRSARVAVPRAWVRARRTILSADTVSFLAAAVLYYFTTDEVRGFAFTLGLSTILDLVVVFLFTHPLVSLLSRLTAFGSARFTGLDALRSGSAIETSPRRERPARTAGRTARSADDGAAATTATAVVVNEDEPDEAFADEPVGPAVDDPTDGATYEPADPDDPEAPRRRTAPEPGSAAERAAARRARMRGRRGDEKGPG